MGLFTKVASNYDNYSRKLKIRLKINTEVLDVNIKEQLLTLLEEKYSIETLKPYPAPNKKQREKYSLILEEIDEKVDTQIMSEKQKLFVDDIEDIDRYNFVTNIDSESIIKWTNDWYDKIKSIVFSDNIDMDDIPEWVNKCKNLEMLSISDASNLKLLPMWITDFSLKVLRLNNTGIQVYPERAIKALKNLEEIDFTWTEFVVKTDYDKSMIIRSIERMKKQVGISIEVNEEKYNKIMAERKINVEDIDLIFRWEKELDF